jgi:ubiquinone/menaquinone biosynthesis C-methylase UbiE
MKKPQQGWEGWDAYAPFYDWENAQTLGRRDIPFWRRLALKAKGRVLELGCGTGRVSLPLARAGVSLIGIDRSPSMLARAVRRAQSLHPRKTLTFVRGDVRALPFTRRQFSAVLAPYGVLQSLLDDGDLTATLESVHHVLARDGTFAIDLVPDVPNWREYNNRVQLRGRQAGGGYLTLIETVRQDRKRRLTRFEQRYVERRGKHRIEHQFELAFRTLSVPQMVQRLERMGFRVEAVLGDYRGHPWDARADVWIILARRW